ncbi:MAG TPA: hypothetical protein V6D17_20490 [Candidatus Obscuribacterales bacterium]
MSDFQSLKNTNYRVNHLSSGVANWAQPHTGSGPQNGAPTVFLNPDGSCTVMNLRDWAGFLHTVYVPPGPRPIAGHDPRTIVDGVPLNPMNADHVRLANLARSIGMDTRLRIELDALSSNDRAILEELVNAFFAGRHNEARMIFRRFKHQPDDCNNFFRLVRPIKTLMLMRKIAPDELLEPHNASISVTYNVNSAGAVLSIYLEGRYTHLWDR